MADFHNWLPHAWVDPGTKFFYCWTMQYTDQYIGLFLPTKTKLGQCIGLCNTEYQLIIRSRNVLCESVRLLTNCLHRSRLIYLTTWFGATM